MIERRLRDSVDDRNLLLALFDGIGDALAVRAEDKIARHQRFVRPAFPAIDQHEQLGRLCHHGHEACPVGAEARTQLYRVVGLAFLGIEHEQAFAIGYGFVREVF